jgi:thiosulfate dehydrogenase [quinone] large subunit
MHARPSASNRLPVVAGVATALVGALNVLSALTDELPIRLRHLLAVLPAGDIRVAHALALPVGLALVGAGNTIGLGKLWTNLELVKRNPWLK